MSAYAASQVRELLARGPQEDEDFYRLRVTGNGSTNWVNVTPSELAAIAQVIDADTDGDEEVPAWRRNLISAVWAALDATSGGRDFVEDQFWNAVGAWTP